MFEGLLSDQLLLFVPFNIIHEACPQQTNHSLLLQIILLHLVLHIHHNLNTNHNVIFNPQNLLFYQTHLHLGLKLQHLRPTDQ